MGTRGFKVYKWQGKYYVYYNHWDSYPSGLGRILLSSIPSKPEQYRAWLQQLRSNYSALAQRLDERVYTVSMDRFTANHTGNKGHDDTVLESLHIMPLNLAPEGDLFIEWVYLIDLDREQFGIHGSCFYHLSKVPPFFEDIMEDAQDYWLGKLRQDEVHESITTDDIHPSPLTDDPTPAFLQMHPTTIHPRQESMLNRMPTFVACKRLYDAFVERFHKHIHQAQSINTESDFLFRELVFALMCFASCSPEWVRFMPTAHMKGEFIDGSKSWSYGAVRSYDNAEWEPKEFMTGFLQRHHLEGMEAGSAPKSTSYWFSEALVYLRRDITSRARFRDAIVSAVAKGKEDGRTQFSAIIVSLKHFILLKYADGNLQHTKRLNFGSWSEVSKVGALRFDHLSSEGNEREEVGNPENEKIAEEKGESTRNSSELGTSNTADSDSPQQNLGDACLSSNETADGRSDDSDWVDDSHVSTFEILAHFFDATEKQRLKPSIIVNDGVFPNEIYQKILGYVDRETNIACRKVSRHFRECASEVFFMNDNGLKLVYRPGKEPDCFHDSFGLMGPPNLVYLVEIDQLRHRGETIQEGCLKFIPAFGKSDGSASMESTIILVFPELKWADELHPFVVERRVLDEADRRIYRLWPALRNKQ
ncbi:hypothetical protein O1611_g5914 [Lasiodiplodia mahajangana]|uniref:Uncharacterized protein n=1 Tax=Lasiodiplodia mahajangana TaxID=1108764 RepID=A0ACC2JKC0_9PEZI|nr:hypothetical protein O1611_g5914 [Lasiodiplodia mahajangana]